MGWFSLKLIAALLLFYSSCFAIADNHVAAKEAMLSQLMQALSQKDYEAFIADGTQTFKQGITKQAFDTVANQVGNRIQDGYQAEYLAQLNQQGHKVHLWKISYATSEEDTLAKLVVNNNKVAGFWLQ